MRVPAANVVSTRQRGRESSSDRSAGRAHERFLRRRHRRVHRPDGGTARTPSGLTISRRVQAHLRHRCAVCSPVGHPALLPAKGAPPRGCHQPRFSGGRQPDHRHGLARGREVRACAVPRRPAVLLRGLQKRFQGRSVWMMSTCTSHCPRVAVAVHRSPAQRYAVTTSKTTPCPPAQIRSKGRRRASPLRTICHRCSSPSGSMRSSNRGTAHDVMTERYWFTGATAISASTAARPR